MKNNSYFSEKSLIYEKSLKEDYKKNNGIFYTDVELANAIVDFLNIPKEASIIDPSCGTGSFLYCLQQKEYKHIYGCDFDMQTVKKCKELTQLEHIYRMDTLGKSGQEILKKVKKEKFDYVIGNPPYAPIGNGVEIKTTAEFMQTVKNSGNNLFVRPYIEHLKLRKKRGIYLLLFLKICYIYHHTRYLEKNY